ncbi:MAG: thioredoxin [Candidatus Calescibacterium sp.]|nr:thioredoxin [Candidatus Calescibacterium sp.]MCX7971901.1 thioredoxin [bacterium]MDW8195000.1 thioredoxin [Candidatus Calescibacterium sp.]
MSVLHVDSATFDKEVLNSPIPVLVDFWAPWCMPCKMLEPIFEEVSKEYQGRVKFVKVNTDDNTDIAQRFFITGIPTLILFKQGKPVNSIIGFVSKKELTRFIEENM